MSRKRVAGSDDVDVFLVLGACHEIMVPLLLRTGLVELAKHEMKVGLKLKASAFHKDEQVAAASIAKHLDRSRNWTTLPDSEDREDERTRAANARNFVTKVRILTWLAARHKASYSPGDVGRGLPDLGYVEAGQIGDLLKIYSTLGFLKVVEGKHGPRYQATGPVVEIPIDEFESRVSQVNAVFARIGPLAESYLKGQAALGYLDASLPEDLWQEFQAKLRESMHAIFRDLVGKSNLPGREFDLERRGHGVFLLGAIESQSSDTVPQVEPSTRTREGR